MTYLWSGTSFHGPSADPNRTGIARMDTRSMTGRVDHVGSSLGVVFDLHRVTPATLVALGFDDIEPVDLKNSEVRNRFAAAYARRLGDGGPGRPAAAGPPPTASGRVG